MKYKILAIVLIIFVCSFNLFAQEREFEVEVSMVETNFKKSAKQIPVKVKITNKAKNSLKTAGLGQVVFTFSTCLISKECNQTFGDLYEGQFSIPAVSLVEDASVEFPVNLADLYWYSPLQSNLNFDEKDSFRKNVKIENIYFHASVRLLKGYKMDEELKAKVPIYDKKVSNVITVVIN